MWPKLLPISPFLSSYVVLYLTLIKNLNEENKKKLTKQPKINTNSFYMFLQIQRNWKGDPYLMTSQSTLNIREMLYCESDELL